MIFPHNRFRVPRQGLDWALRPFYLRRAASYSSVSRAAALTAAGLGTTASVLYLAPGPGRNDAPRLETQFTAFLPSPLPPYDPFAKKALNPITVQQAEAFLYANQRSLNWRVPSSAVLRASSALRDLSNRRRQVTTSTLSV